MCSFFQEGLHQSYSSKGLKTQQLKALAALVRDGEFGTLHPHGGSQQSVTAIPEDKAFVLAEWVTEFTWCTDIHVGNTPIHISKSFFKKSQDSNYVGSRAGQGESQ